MLKRKCSKRLPLDTDNCSVTLLWRFDNILGLQDIDRGQEVWMDVPMVKNSIVLNVGDVQQRWTNDLLKSTPHIVINTEMTRSRYSMPYFVHLGRDVIIDNLTDQTDKYPPISANEYLKWRLAQSYTDNSYIENEDVAATGTQHLTNY